MIKLSRETHHTLKPVWQYSFEELVALMEGNYVDNYRRYEQYTEDRCPFGRIDAMLFTIVKQWNRKEADWINILLVILSREDIYPLYAISNNEFVVEDAHVVVEDDGIYWWDPIPHFSVCIESLHEMSPSKEGTMRWVESYISGFKDVYDFDHETHIEIYGNNYADLWSYFHVNIMIESLLVAYALDRHDIVARDIHNIECLPIYAVDSRIGHFLARLEEGQIDYLPTFWQETICQVRATRYMFKDYNGVKFTINSLIDAGVYPVVRWLYAFCDCSSPIEDVIKYELYSHDQKSATYMDFMTQINLEVSIGIVLKHSSVLCKWNSDVHSEHADDGTLYPHKRRHHYSGYHELFVETRNNVERIIVNCNLNSDDINRIKDVALIHNIPVDIVGGFGTPRFCKKYMSGFDVSE